MMSSFILVEVGNKIASVIANIIDTFVKKGGGDPVEIAKDLIKAKIVSFASDVCKIKDTYRPWVHHPLEEFLVKHFNSVKSRPGIAILNCPVGFGKSTRTRSALQLCIEQRDPRITGAIYCKMPATNCHTTTHESIMDALGIKNIADTRLHLLFPTYETTVVIIDQIEVIANKPDFTQYCIGLAAQSVDYTNLYIIMLCNKESVAQQLLAVNSGGKVYNLIGDEYDMQRIKFDLQSSIRKVGESVTIK